MQSLGIDRLSVEERLDLVEEIWDSIAADSSAIPLTEAQRVELERRYQDDEARPDDAMSWEELKALTDRRTPTLKQR
jgi:putative addiction module component (TIGR02574 family)